ncbi:hypothetical protein FRB95_002703 [Tulasnella sp. JGI-2019a]|nr:hypothetical protein FRB95_002703 [Tulasnella sp. JGI-2019a]
MSEYSMDEEIHVVGAYLKRHHETCEFEDMLKALLLRTVEAGTSIQSPSLADCLEKILPLCEGLKDELTEYGEEITSFVGLANTALERVKSLNFPGTQDQDILFHVNHQQSVSYQDDNANVKHIPDVVVVTLTAALEARQPDSVEKTWDDVALITAKRPPHKAFEWKDIRFALEFEPINKPPAQPPTNVTLIYNDSRAIPDGFHNSEFTLSLASDPESDLPTPPAALRKLDQTVNSDVPKRHDSKCKSISRNTDNNPSARSGGNTCSGQSEPDYPQIPVTRPLDVNVQTALYGTEILSAPEGLATSAIALAIVGDIVHIWWFDRQGAIQTNGLNFVQHLPYFLVLLFALQRMEMKICRENASPLELSLEPQESYHYSMVGRATKVFPAASSSVDHRHSFDLRPGISEGDTPSEASCTLHGLDLVVKLSHVQGDRISETEIISEAIRLAKESSDPDITNAILGHIPEVVAACDYPEYDTKHIRDDVGIHGEHGTENRRPRVLVLRCLKPMTEAPAREFLAIFWDYIMCHYALWILGIHHRDISVNNLMYYVDRDGKCRGVLNDFDLATISSRTDVTETERAGTLPFMAMDLLKPAELDGEVVHRYRHDLEAFFWVLMWVCCCFNGAQEVRRLPLMQWTRGPAACLAAKAQLLICSSEISPTPFHSDNWEVAGYSGGDSCSIRTRLTNWRD